MKIVTIKLELDDRVYEELLRKAKEEGFSTIADYVNSLILKTLEKSGRESVSELAEDQRKTMTLSKLLSVVERKVLDSINPFTQKIDDISRKLASVVERLEVLEERMNTVEEKVKNLEKAPSKPMKETTSTKMRKTAIEILKEQKVILERDIANKIRDRDTFFAKLEREGAVVLECKDERMALDPQFWQQLQEKLRNIKTNNDEELRKILDPLEFKVVQKLRESALLVFDSTSKTWNFVL